ncbi:MAG: insulinase family protein [Cellvibrio sp.]
MTHPAFEFIRKHPLASLNLTLEEYRHKKTGAQHLHLACDSEENVFLVALRTVPEDSRGVAHILEHTALCGSEKYPVRDPFFMMVRRSLNTFMNAFTSSDWTAYPFASQNRKDFNNLLNVYLDAVFFSRLDPLDFAQEGHRVEFAETTNPESDLVYKGVVFNEMKGAMSSVPSQLWHTLCKYLYPTTTYHHNSGGDPAHIPDLTYEQLKEFYETHYHPSNAIFMTYGNIPVGELQTTFEEQALSKFSRLDKTIAVPDEKRYFAPVRVQESYPITEEDNGPRKAHVVMAWLLGKTTNLDETLEAQLLSNILFDNSASPLQQALETSEFGDAPSPLCGLDDSSKELAFVCGLEGCDPADADNIEAMIIETLTKVAEEGVPQDQVEASLHQLELSQREVGGDGYPYGLQLILTALTAATHRGDAVALLDLDRALNSLREKVRDPEFIQKTARKWLIDNPHRVRLLMTPDTQMSARAQAAEVAQLAAKKAAMTDEEKQAVIDQALALQERQQQIDDETILPKVGIPDIPPGLHYTEGSRETLNGYPLRCYEAGTNGLVYQQINFKLPALTERQLQLLPFYCICLTELGVAGKSYLETQLWQSEVVGSLNGFSTIRGDSDDVQAIDAYFTLSSRALSRNSLSMNQLMKATLDSVSFNEHDRIRELVTQNRTRREQSITGNGHGLAMTAACAGMSPSAKVAHELGGLKGIAWVKALDNSLNDKDYLVQFCDELAEIHQLIAQSPKQFLLVGEKEKLEQYRQDVAQTWPENYYVAQGFECFDLEPVSHKVAEAWITNTQVNFVAKAYPSVPLDHPDAAALTVLGGFLRNGFLHRAIREQGGAYGGGASQDNNSAAFRFYSYRDPRLTETLTDFDAAIDWMLSHDHTEQSLEEAILGVVGSIDKPGSPAGEAKSTYQAELFGRTREKRERFRNRVIGVTLEDLKRVTATYLDKAKASVALVTHAGNKSDIEALGLDLKQV